jgi:pimeloyl-ACP methyl ester carboxylesterase
LERFQNYCWQTKARRLRFFSGFGFADESALFGVFLPDRAAPFCVAGFSLGAIAAFKYAISCEERVERLLLISPAFFQDKNERFRRAQLMGFTNDRAKYMQNFYANCGAFNDRYIDRNPQKNELELLLNYRWNAEEIKRLNVASVEVIIGANDKIINAKAAYDFFLGANAKIKYIKKANHLLQIEG